MLRLRDPLNREQRRNLFLERSDSRNPEPVLNNRARLDHNIIACYANHIISQEGTPDLPAACVRHSVKNRIERRRVKRCDHSRNASER